VRSFLTDDKEMTLYQFNALPYERQLVAVFDTGLSLMIRWEEEFVFKLYGLPGRFFVKLEFNTASSNIIGLRGFTSLMQLLNWLNLNAHMIKLPWPLIK
jgi:hypothetical protein